METNQARFCETCYEPMAESVDGFCCRNGHVGAASKPAVHGSAEPGLNATPDALLKSENNHG